MDFYERKWDILYSRFADAVRKEKKRLEIKDRYVKDDVALEAMALIYPETKEELELVPSFEPVFCLI